LNYIPPSQFFTEPKLVNDSVTILKALLILGEVEIDGTKYAIGEATDGSGWCISVVMTISQNGKTVGESLVRYDTSIATLISLAQKASEYDLLKIRLNLAMNLHFFD
jgi:hypothetical protein